MTSIDYSNLNYWDERYAYEDTTYDWYQSYSDLKPILDQLIPRNDGDFEILIPGCGNSTLGPCLYQDGQPNITNIDFSTVVIQQMKERYSHLDEMEFIAMNVLKMDYIPDDCFDLIIDKGLFDCQLCSQSNISNAHQLTKEMYRVLKPGGVYLMLSHGPPDNRLGYLQRSLAWKVEYKTIAKPTINGYVLDEQEIMKYHYIYFCRKM